MPGPLTLRPGCSLESKAGATPDGSNQNPNFPGRFRSAPRRALSALVARPSWGIEWRPRTPPKCSSVTRGQLINAQGRGRGAPPLSPRAPGRVSAGQQAAAVPGVAGCSAPSTATRVAAVRTAPGDAMCCDFGDLVNQTQVFSCSHFPLDTCSSACPPPVCPGMPTSHV